MLKDIEYKRCRFSEGFGVGEGDIDGMRDLEGKWDYSDECLCRGGSGYV